MIFPSSLVANKSQSKYNINIPLGGLFKWKKLLWTKISASDVVPALASLLTSSPSTMTARLSPVKSPLRAKLLSMMPSLVALSRPSKKPKLQQSDKAEVLRRLFFFTKKWPLEPFLSYLDSQLDHMCDLFVKAVYRLEKIIWKPVMSTISDDCLSLFIWENPVFWIRIKAVKIVDNHPWSLLEWIDGDFFDCSEVIDGEIVSITI